MNVDTDSPATSYPAIRELSTSSRIRVGVVCDFLEEQWPSMDLVGDMLTRYLADECSAATAVTQLRPAWRQRLAHIPLVPEGAARNADRLLNRFNDYPRWLRRSANNFDLFHLVDHSYSHLLHALPNRKTVVTCHDLDTFRCLIEPDRDARPRWFRAMTQKILDGFRLAAHVIAVSSATREELVRHGLASPERITVIPNGVHPSCSPLPDPGADAAAARLMPDEGRNAVWLLNVGSSVPRKRLDVLLRVFAAILPNIPAARLVRVGGFTPAQLQLARELEVEHAVVSLPFLDRDLLAAVYRRATLLLHTAAAEGFGLPLIEALASGCPVAASDLPVLREVGGSAACYCPVAEVEVWTRSVIQLLEEHMRRPDNWESRRRQGLSWAARFSWSAAARETVALYQRVLRYSLIRMELKKDHRHMALLSTSTDGLQSAKAAAFQPARTWHAITCEYPPSAGGVSDYVYLVAQGLASAGDEVHIWCPAGAGYPPALAGVEVHAVFGHFSPIDLRKAGRAISAFPAPRRLFVQWVPHGFGYKSVNLPFCLWLWFRSVFRGDEVDLMVHEPFLPFHKTNLAQNAAAIIHRLMIFILLRSAARVWVSTPTWERFLRPYALGRNHTYRWLPLASNVLAFDDASGVSAIRDRYAPGGLLVGHFGTFSPSLTPMLRTIIPSILKKQPDASLLLIGGGGTAFRDEVVRQHPDLERRLHAVGQISARDPQLSLHLSACDLLIQPYPDGVTSRRTTVMAALSHGRPTVTTTGVLTESFWETSGAVALTPATESERFVEASMRLLDSPRERVALGNAGQEYYRREFDVHRVIDLLRSAS